MSDEIAAQLEIIMANRFEGTSPHERFMAAHALMHRLAARVPELKSVRVSIRYHRPKRAEATT